MHARKPIDNYQNIMSNSALINLEATRTSQARSLSMLRTALAAILPFLDDENVIEITLNPDGRVWVDEAGKGMRLTDITMSAADAGRAVRLLASAMNDEITADKPSLAASLPGYGEPKLDQLLNSLAGPVARVGGAAAIIIFGIALAFAGEAGAGIRRGLWLIFGLTIAFRVFSHIPRKGIFQI